MYFNVMTTIGSLAVPSASNQHANAFWWCSVVEKLSVLMVPVNASGFVSKQML